MLLASGLLGILAMLGAGLGPMSVQETDDVELDADLAPEDRVWVSYQREQSIRDLLRFCSLDYDLEIEFEPSQVEGRVNVPPGRRLTTSKIWAMAHRALAAKGLTTVQMPGALSLRVVAISEAAELARLEAQKPYESRAGFLKVLLPIRRVDMEEVTAAITLVLTSEGSMAELRDTKALVISDLAPNVRQAIELVRILDEVGVEIAVEEIDVEHVSPVTLAAWVGQLDQAINQVSGESRSGKLVANAEAGTVMVVAPEHEMPEWRKRVARYDRAERAYVDHYTPERFGLVATADLIERVVYAGGSKDPAETWRLVTDQLTGTLIVTAPQSKHLEIEKLMARLESTEFADRRPIRAFPIRNRQVAEMFTLLEKLVEAEALITPRSLDSTSRPAEPVQGATGVIPDTDRAATLESESGVTLTADETTNRIIAMGEGRRLDQLEALIRTLDVRHAQVLIEAVVVNLSETDTFDLGVELRRAGTSGGTMFELASLFGLSSVTAGSTSIPAAAGSGFSGVVLDPRDFSAVVRALETVNDGRSLTIPKVLVNNNQDAVLESVAQSPFASTNASDTVATTSFGGTLDAGTSINVKPQITEGDHLVLDYTVSLSSFTGDSADPNLPPPRQENRLESIVTIPDGHCIVVGGLEMETETEATSKVPWLGDVPLLGSLFSSRSRSRTKTRFFVFLRANILRSNTFADLAHISEAPRRDAGVGSGFPTLKPRIIQ